MTTAHKPIHKTKESRGYVTDDGQVVPPHTLHLYDCSCGQRQHAGLAWYADENRARRAYERKTTR